MDTSDAASLPVMEIPLTEVLENLLRIEGVRSERFFVVGGVVRDLVMQRSSVDHDLDVVVEGVGLEVARELAGTLNSTIVEHRQFLTAKIRGPFLGKSSADGRNIDEVDIATARLERYEKPGALPVVSPASIEEDLWRRDFSVNAIALPLSTFQEVIEGSRGAAVVERYVIDPTGGIADIHAAVLRVLHANSFVDDPTRLFRAVRYLVRLSLHFDMPTLAGFVEAVRGGRLATLTPRRVWNEVLVALDENSVCEVLQEFTDRGLFSDLPIIVSDDATWLFESLERLEQLRSFIGCKAFFEAGKLLLLANLSRLDRHDVARAVHEGRRALRQADMVLKAQNVPANVVTVSEIAAAYCVHCTDVLRERLQQALREAVA